MNPRLRIVQSASQIAGILADGLFQQGDGVIIAALGLIQHGLVVHDFKAAGGVLTRFQKALFGAVELMHRIRNDFKYDPKATVVSTPLEEVFEKRHGVCQDFAHVMIAGLRGLGLPAAYVSGYLRTIPPPGKPRLQGADATHAWVSLWCGEQLGWIGFDPTNDVLVENDHIVLAMGRDFSDVSPVDGIIVGSRRQKLSVKVDVLPVG